MAERNLNQSSVTLTTTTVAPPNHTSTSAESPTTTSAPSVPLASTLASPITTATTTPPTSPDSIPIPTLQLTPPPPPSSFLILDDPVPLTPEKVRNQAPGILDRRKTFRPSLGSTKSNRKSSGISIRLTMADMASEMRVKEDEDDRMETFEDAESTPTEPIVAANASIVSANANAKSNPTPDPPSSLSTDKAPAESIAAKVDTPRDAEHTTEGASEAVDTEKEEHTQLNTHILNGSDLPTPPHSHKASVASTASEPVVPASISTPPPGSFPESESVSRGRSPSLSRVSPALSQVSPRQGSPEYTAQPALSGEVSIPAPPPPTDERPRNLDVRRTSETLSTPPAQAPTLVRKASSGFGGLLARMGSIRKGRSPSVPRASLERRSTTASVASLDGTITPSVAEGGKPSLQDQFASLRRQEELGMADPNGPSESQEHNTTRSRGHSVTADGQVSPTSNQQQQPPPLPPKDTNAPVVTDKLPPGTAAGISAGPAPEPKAVNWDLWQQLVYEGPAAVARTSGQELRNAIAAGIPHAIRGVVWQVLAESKSEELESMYRTLKARGTTELELRPRHSRAHSRNHSRNTSLARSTLSDIPDSPAKPRALSDASSEHSQHSATHSAASSPPLNDIRESHSPERVSILLAEKKKRDSVALKKLEKAIKRDMGTRTSYSKYTQSAGLQDGLFGVCKAYALFDEGIGYAQGINFIAMPLLFNVTEEEAFVLLTRLMHKYDLRSLFVSDMRGLHLRLYQFERLLEEYEPAVYCHLRRKHVSPELYATQWFLTLFAYRFPLQLVLRIYDLIFVEGLSAILKFGLVLMQRNRDALLSMKDMSQLTNFLKEKIFDVYIDKSPSASSRLDSGFFGAVTGGVDKEIYRADEMVRDACNVTISDDMLKAYTTEYEDQQRALKEREGEIEALRTHNASLSAEVKVLRERAQQYDSEHVVIASDLVRIKVENDGLQDSNEALRTQVTELQKMVDLQPAEVEEKLKSEMDRIMQRNIEVQNENRNIKEEMDEMEQELVRTKMAHAQVQSDLDSLKQKWASVQAMLEKDTPK